MLHKLFTNYGSNLPKRERTTQMEKNEREIIIEILKVPHAAHRPV